ncbi:gamma-tubulin [Ascoidea rubescens DSM 1968]|uniref:Tubulin gamma chain n=1 Tax=Ascoidea rubescens DSM 1968 TaxID=1344418 RepID=A0A1D2VI38_9ASCO|nr:tubulin nucleotide-binding domain-like protein [Ascoidea rubescens DSM 1968]ODV61314.1 tubulin nucleotide-binding domain-like protein [Ascoidea rubescens DSM 1968]
MPGEIITLQAGQCGNQIGQQFWQQICAEHGISLDGEFDASLYSANNNNSSNSPFYNENNILIDDRKNIFFYESDNNRYTPRSILIDLEPRVLSTIQNKLPNLFNPKNYYSAKNGSGAGNNWLSGFNYSYQHNEELLDVINKEIDSCDNFEGFKLIHSVAGGTGSGLGSYCLESLNDNFPKKLINTYSIFPSNSGNNSSDVVVQPYNTLLTLKRLIEFSDSTILMDNESLTKISIEIFNENEFLKQSISFNEINQLISTIISNLTNSIRFPNYMYNSLTSIYSNLIPLPNLHFLIPSYYPFTIDYVDNVKKIRKNSIYEILLELLNKDNKLLQISNSNGGNYLSMLSFLNCSSKQNDIQRAILKIQERVSFVPWATSNINLLYTKKSPYLKYNRNSKRNINNSDNNSGSNNGRNKPLNMNSNNDVSGLMLSNETNIVVLFKKILKNFDKLIKRNAFLENYKKGAGSLFSEGSSGNNELIQEFNDSKESVQNLIDAYTACDSTSYLADLDSDDERNGAVVEEFEHENNNPGGSTQMEVDGEIETPGL